MKIIKHTIKFQYFQLATMDFTNKFIKLPTITVITHISLVYFVIDGNYELTLYEDIKYYIGLFIITYATEYCSVLRDGRNYREEYQYFDNYILFPLLIVPTILASLYSIGFSIVNLITVTRIVTALLSFTILYIYHRNYSFIIPLLITYIPFLTIIIHVCVISSSLLLVNFNNFLDNQIR